MKMAFTASLRKILFGLLAAMCFIFMFLYWNQSLELKMPTSIFGEYEKPTKNKLVTAPVEKYDYLFYFY